MTEKQFTIMTNEAERKSGNFPRTIPFGLIQEHEIQALYNHGGQTLDRLNQRGGLDPLELYYVLNDRKITWADPITPEIIAIAWKDIIEKVNEYNARTQTKS